MAKRKQEKHANEFRTWYPSIYRYPLFPPKLVSGEAAKKAFELLRPVKKMSYKTFRSKLSAVESEFDWGRKLHDTPPISAFKKAIENLEASVASAKENLDNAGPFVKDFIREALPQPPGGPLVNRLEPYIDALNELQKAWVKANSKATDKEILRRIDGRRTGRGAPTNVHVDRAVKELMSLWDKCNAEKFKRTYRIIDDGDGQERLAKPCLEFVSIILGDLGVSNSIDTIRHTIRKISKATQK